MGQKVLPAGEGMLLTPAPAIHTAFMRFPIDAVFLDRNLRILDMVEGLRPWRFASRRRARSVLELPAGECARRGLRAGDRLGLRERKPIAAEPVAPPDRQLGRRSGSVIWPSSAERSELARLRPMRVLVVSGDRHFRSVTSMLLTHRGCSVSATAKASQVTEQMVRDGADVVLVEAGPDTAAARSAAEAAAVARSVGIVLVSDGPLDSPRPRVLDKWGPFEELYAAIEEADERPGDGRRNGGGA